MNSQCSPNGHLKYPDRREMFDYLTMLDKIMKEDPELTSNEEV